MSEECLRKLIGRKDNITLGDLRQVGKEAYEHIQKDIGKISLCLIIIQDTKIGDFHKVCCSEIDEEVRN